MFSTEIQSLLDAIERDGLLAALDPEIDWSSIEDVDPDLYEQLTLCQQDVGILMNTLHHLEKDTAP